jgi:hypothetical protein
MEELIDERRDANLGVSTETAQQAVKLRFLLMGMGPKTAFSVA